ncbi:MAG: hypothetical protein NTU97_02065 [Candidatus Magasanikbacteria bacterium]|nr:hypothetical protein [Candidatus Magasanikbacteria bacterium]
MALLAVAALAFAAVMLEPVISQNYYAAYPQPTCPHGTEVYWYTTDDHYDLSEKQVVSTCRNPRTMFIVGEERVYDKESAQLLAIHDRTAQAFVATVYRMGGFIKNFAIASDCGGAKFTFHFKDTGTRSYKFLNPCNYVDHPLPPAPSVCDGTTGCFCQDGLWIGSDGMPSLINGQPVMCTGAGYKGDGPWDY